MGDEQSVASSIPACSSKKSKSYVKPAIGISAIVLVAGALMGWWVWWINQSEEYPITSFSQQVYKEGTSGCYSEIHFSCIDDYEQTMVVATPLNAVTVGRRNDGRQITSIVFSDVDWRDGNPVKYGQSATILVATAEDAAIWERYLVEKRAEVECKKILPRRVVPDLGPVSAESPANK
ncbi:MAG: hypothetical protein AAB345_02035 [Patescibacteria group bacterium]